MSVKKGTIAVFLSTVLRNLLSFGAVAYFSRSAGISVLGTFFLFQTVISMLSIPVDLGLRTGVEKRLSEGEPAGSVLGSALAVKLVMILVFAIGILIFSPMIESYIGEDISYLLIIGLVLHELGQLGEFTLRGEQRVSETAFFAPLRTAAWAIIGALLLEYGFGYRALLYGYIVALFVIAAVAIWRIDSPIGRPSLVRIRSLIGYSKYAAIGTVGGLVYNWADVFLIGLFLSQAAVGAYEVAWRVATASLLLSNSIRTAIFPKANELGGKKAYDQLESLIATAFIPSMYLVFPALIGVLIIGDEILSVGFAVDYSGVYLVLSILLFEKLQRSILLVLIAPMHATGKVKYDAYTTLLGVVLNIGLNLILIPRYGIIGAAIGTTIAATINTATHAWILSQVIDITIPFKSLTWCGVSAVIMGVVLLMTKTVVVPTSIISLAILIGISAAVYISVSFLSPMIRGEVTDQVQAAISR